MMLRDLGTVAAGGAAAYWPFVELQVGFDAVEVETLEGSAVERRVPLPDRWVKRFSEVQVAVAGLEPALELEGVAGQRFLRALPRGQAGKAGAVRLEGEGAVVRSGEKDYAVRLDPPRCSSSWWSMHPGDRGPCKHLLAAQLAVAQAPDPGIGAKLAGRAESNTG